MPWWSLAKRLETACLSEEAVNPYLSKSILSATRTIFIQWTDTVRPRIHLLRRPTNRELSPTRTQPSRRRELQSTTSCNETSNLRQGLTHWQERSAVPQIGELDNFVGAGHGPSRPSCRVQYMYAVLGSCAMMGIHSLQEPLLDFRHSEPTPAKPWRR